MRRTALLLLSFGLLAAASHSAVLKPEAAGTIQAAFERMRPGLRYESVRIDRDHVLARVCGDAVSTPCFALRLEAPEDCQGLHSGPYCVTFPEGAPPFGVVQQLDSALKVDAGKDLWTLLPRAAVAPSVPPVKAMEPNRIGEALRAWMTFPQLLVLALALGLALWGRGRPRRDWALALAIGLGAALWLNHVNPPAWAGDDEAMGLLLSQDCVRQGVCHTESIDSGLPGFTNGAVWLHLLTLISWLGGAATATRLIVIALMSTGVASVYLTTRRWIGSTYAPAAAVFSLYGLAMGGDLSASNLVDASAVFLPAALSACALLIFVQTRQLLALVMGAAFLSLAITTHVAAASLLPALIAAAAFGDRRPMVSVLLATATGLALACLTSLHAVLDSWTHAPGFVKGTAIGGWLLLLVLGVLSPRWFSRLSSAWRSALLGAWLLLPHLIGALWLHLQHRPPTDRYLPPIIAPAAVVMAVVLVGGLQRLARSERLAQLVPLTLGFVALLLAPPPRVASQWSFEDGRIVAEHLAKKSWCYPEQFGRLQGPQCTSAAYATMPYACTGSGGSDFRRQLRLWITDREHVPQDVETLRGDGDHVLLLSGIDGWLDKQHAERCFTQGEQRTCMSPEAPDAAPFLYSKRRELGFGNALYPPPFTMSFSFPMHPVAGQTHQFSFVDDPRSFGPEAGKDTTNKVARCGWQITQATGVVADRPLPANPVRLTSTDGAPGRLVIERVVGGPDCPAGFPGRQIPCHLETTPDDPSWMREP